MKQKRFYTVGLSIASIAALFIITPVHAASTTQMKACKIAVLDKSQFSSFPMAAVSVRPGSKNNHVRFNVDWEGATGHGNCKVSTDGYVKEVNVKQFKAAGGHHKDHSGFVEQDDFWRDKSGRWIDPDGEVCHSCTPENGFPAAQKKHTKDIDGFYYDRHTGHWRDPGGETCYSCTPENGFPDQ